MLPYHPDKWQRVNNQLITVLMPLSFPCQGALSVATDLTVVSEGRGERLANRESGGAALLKAVAFLWDQRNNTY